MTQDENSSLEQRVLRLEERLEAIAASLGGRDSRNVSPPPTQEPRNHSRYVNPLATRSLEWWLARGGAILTSLALLLLYQYAVERNWITPLVRVFAGLVVGVALLFFASRIERRSSDANDDVVGLREVLLGAGLAAWYITAYAAAIFYGLIPLGTARLVFLALSIGGAWLALSEHRSVLGFLTLGVGFLTPVLLPSTKPFIPSLALYLGALTAVGLVLYLMRGWQSILWLTASAFWWTAGLATESVAGQAAGFVRITGSLISARVALTLLIIAAGAAMLRTPLLRRRLVGTGSTLYTQPTRSAYSESVQDAVSRRIEIFSGVKGSVDSAALWVITIMSPLLAVLFLSWIWTAIESAAWGVASLALAGGAYRLATSGPDEEFNHVEAAATVVWSLAGILWLADSVGSPSGEASAFMLGAAAAHAWGVLRYLRSSQFIAAQKIALATAMFSLFVVLVSETIFDGLVFHGYDAVWTAAELVVAGACLSIWWTRRSEHETLGLPTVFGLGAYVALMFIDARILSRVWPPLVTASFAVAGAALLMIGHGQQDARTLRRLGGFTLTVVVARLFMIDLASVETIWRVLLFLGCGALFLFTSHRLQGAAARETTEPAS